MFDLSEICSLFSLINIPIMPGSFITLFQGMKFFTFSFFPNLLTLIETNEMINPEPYRILTSNAQYHPNIFLLFHIDILMLFLNNL